MNIAEIKGLAVGWIGANWLQLAITAATIIVYLVIDRVTAPRLEESAEQGRFRVSEAQTAIGVARVIGAVIALAVLIFTWGVDIGALLFFTTTTVTLLGVALFATWSILSNVTAYFILLLQPSFRRGNFVRIIDLDNYIEGYISELRLFNTKLVTEKREIIIYPNNLMLGRPAIVNPRNRLNAIGKIAESTDAADVEGGMTKRVARSRENDGE